MSLTNFSNSTLHLKPLGAGDLIDRSVRFYRNNFWTFILIASPPIIVGAIFLIGWMFLARSLFSVSANDPLESGFYEFFVGLGGIVIWFIQLIAVFVVMGGASRNFVRHILFDEPITFRETYKNIRSRLFGMIAVSTLLTFLIGFFGLILLYLGILVATILILISAWAFSFLPVVAFLVSLAFGVAVALGTLWVFFLVASRFIYVPQVMLVEGQGAVAAIGRSSTLAGKNIRRVAALFIFTIFATYSALSLFYVPLGWYAWLNGINIFDFVSADVIPAWYEIATQVVGEISLILLTPILMIGLCLLYVDERVRGEGYDIELMAVQRLGEIPSVPQKYVNPLQPAISKDSKNQVVTQTQQTPKTNTVTQEKNASQTNSVLGLD